MATLTICFSDEEMRRLETLGKREGLTVEQMVRLSVCEFIGQPGDAFHATAKCVMEKNAELDGSIDLTHLHIPHLRPLARLAISSAPKCV
jgi:hypothetical protein